MPAKLYANEGVAQFIFLKGNEKPETTYADRNGKYHGQTGANITQNNLWINFLIFGQKSSKDKVKISGSKNASLPILAATLII